MEYQEFKKWLKETKKMQERSARDVLCRLNRVNSFVGKVIVDKDTLKKLDDSEKFRECTTAVKAQLKRAVRLYIEFLG